MPKVSDEKFYDGVVVEIAFSDRRPTFGDLFEICGDIHPNFPPTGTFQFSALADLQFEQVDDYFGVRSLTDEGDDVVVWLFPLVEGVPIHHHDGPFDGLRLKYNVLRNPVRHADHFLRCVQELAAIGSAVKYCGDELDNGHDVGPIRRDIDTIVRHWASKGNVVGSSQALQLDH